MRSLGKTLLPLLASSCLATGCATTTWSGGGATREVEVAYDDGHPAERPILPNSSFELLVKNEPNIPAYRPVRLRFLVAQPGRLLFRFYDTAEDGRPGKLIYTIDREYGAALTSSGSDGKWLIENLPELPVAQGPMWVGVSLPDESSEARVWVAQNDSGHVFQRDVEPQTAIQSSPVHYTPMVRLVLHPE